MMMNRKLANDLAAWESGIMSAEELVARHPSQASEVRRLTGVFTEMRSLADEPVADPTKGWNEVRSRMALHAQVARQPVSLLDRLSPRLQRKLAIGMAAALLVVPPVAMAAANETVRDGFTVVLGEIDDVIFGAGGQTAAGQNEDGSPVELEVGGTDSTPSSTGLPRISETDDKAPATKSDSAGPLSGPDGGNGISAGGSLSTQTSAPAPDGAAGTNGGSGVEGPDGSGRDGESKDGADAQSADAAPGPTPSPSPSPSQGTADSAASASSPSAP